MCLVAHLVYVYYPPPPPPPPSPPPLYRKCPLSRGRHCQNNTAFHKEFRYKHEKFFYIEFHQNKAALNMVLFIIFHFSRLISHYDEFISFHLYLILYFPLCTSLYFIYFIFLSVYHMEYTFVILITVNKYTYSNT